MSSRKSLFKKDNFGFSLVELIIIIAIIGTLVVIGYIIYSSLQRTAKDSKKKADVSAIAKAYEIKYQPSNAYAPLQNNNALSTVPKTPEGGDYFNVVASDGSGFKVCAALEGNPDPICNTTSGTCYCLTSAQGDINPESTLIGYGSELGLNPPAGSLSGGDTPTPLPPAACDTTSSLATNLAGYWKFDEGSGTTVGDSSTRGIIGTWRGTGSHWGTDTPNANFTSSGLFNGSGDAVDLANAQILYPSPENTISVSAWIKPLAFPVVGADPVATSAIIAGNLISSYSLQLRQDGKLYFGYTFPHAARGTSPGTFGLQIGGADSLQLNTWYNVIVAANFTTGELETYINGQGPFITTGPSGIYTSVIPSPFTFSLGSQPSASHYFNGNIDDVRIYKRLLTPTEVTNIYNNGAGCFAI